MHGRKSGLQILGGESFNQLIKILKDYEKILNKMMYLKALEHVCACLFGLYHTKR